MLRNVGLMQAMLQRLSIKEAIITVDAMHCQTKTAEIIWAERADYILQIKDNQRNLHKEISAFFHKTCRDVQQALKTGYYQEKDKTHGRINERNCRLLLITNRMTGMELWQDIRSVVEGTCQSTFKKKGKDKIQP
jgi:predicted transposase YbfD/YdcC